MRKGEAVVLGEIHINLAQQSVVADTMTYRKSFLLIASCPHEINQSEALAVSVAVNECFVRQDRRALNWTRSCAKLDAQVGTRKSLENILAREKEERFVPLDGSTHGPAKLLPAKI